MALPKTTFEQRQAFYTDFLRLLRPGFLTSTVTLEGVFFSLRSLVTSDWFLLRHKVPPTSTDAVYKRWVVAQSVWLMQGTNVLLDQNASSAIYAALRKLPNGALDKLFFVVHGLNQRAQRALDAAEAFSYEPYSRTLWLQLFRSPLCDTVNSGIVGTANLGMNDAQRMWVTSNTFLDKKEERDVGWAEAKLIASASAPKGVEKLNQKDANAFREDDERKQRIKDRFYYRCIKVLDESNQVIGREKKEFMAASSPDELAEEMRKWVTGDQDFHDAVVQNYKDRIIAGYEAAEQDRLRRLARVQEELKLENIDEPLRLVGFTPEQMSDRIKKRNAEQGRVAGAGQVGYADGRSYLYDRYLERNPESGVLRDDGGKLTDQKQSTPNLNQQISGRQVTGGLDGTE